MTLEQKADYDARELLGMLKEEEKQIIDLVGNSTQKLLTSYNKKGDTQ